MGFYPSLLLCFYLKVSKKVIFCLFWQKKRTIVYADFERNTLGILAFCTAQFSARNLQKGYILPFFNKKKSQCTAGKNSVTPSIKNNKKKKEKIKNKEKRKKQLPTEHFFLFSLFFIFSFFFLLFFIEGVTLFLPAV